MKTDIKQIARDTINMEAEAVRRLSDYVDEDFEAAVHLIFQNKGRVIVSGIGKSAIIASKIVATFNSTGTPAVFMHAADAIHGDLGNIQPDDVVLCLSKSGNTPEIKVLVPYIKRFGNKIIGVVSDTQSFLARQADYVIKATIDKEACPNNLAPTASTTTQLVMGDALAAALLRVRGFSSDDFAKYHPGGSLGKRLYLRINDLYVHNEVPKVSVDAPWREVIMEISSKLLGVTAVMDQHNHLAGIITDGDLRRMLQHNESLEQLTAKDIMTTSPRTIDCNALAIEAFNIMETNNITQILVLKEGRYAGVVHIHDILKEGIV